MLDRPDRPLRPGEVRRRHPLAKPPQDLLSGWRGASSPDHRRGHHEGKQESGHQPHSGYSDSKNPPDQDDYTTQSRCPYLETQGLSLTLAPNESAAVLTITPCQPQRLSPTLDHGDPGTILPERAAWAKSPFSLINPRSPTPDQEVKPPTE